MGLEGFERLGLRGDEVVEAAQAVGDALLFLIGVGDFFGRPTNFIVLVGVANSKIVLGIEQC